MVQHDHKVFKTQKCPDGHILTSIEIYRASPESADRESGCLASFSDRQYKYHVRCVHMVQDL